MVLPDIPVDILATVPAQDLPVLRIDTERAGPFTFLVGVDAEAVRLSLIRVDDAWRRFSASPLAQVANQLQREVLVESVFGTNTIEGAELTEEETSRALDLDPAKVQAQQDIRVRNIKAAYDLAIAATERADFRLSVDFMQAVHTEICRDLQHELNRPGVLRDNSKDNRTLVGDADHGGVYRPPQNGRDIRRLLQGLVDWHDELVRAGLSPLVRAPLVHLYFELIHPFWDGNGRVGRVLEASLLRHAGYRYAPFALARHYLEHIHAYFTLFNTCRKAAAGGDPHPNTAFVQFHLDGLRSVIDRLHDRVNGLVKALLFDAGVRQLLDAKGINARQYAIVRHVMEHGRPLPLDTLRGDPRYRALYAGKTDKTRQRDLRGLRDLGLLWQDEQDRLWPGFAQPKPGTSGG